MTGLELRGEIIRSPRQRGTWFEAYGVTLCSVGEDGDWIALGVIEPLRMLAAIRKVARNHHGDWDPFGDPSWWHGVPLIDSVHHTRALFTTDELDGEHDWYAYWSAAATAHPAAVPVTMCGEL